MSRRGTTRVRSRLLSAALLLAVLGAGLVAIEVGVAAPAEEDVPRLADLIGKSAPEGAPAGESEAAPAPGDEASAPGETPRSTVLAFLDDVKRSDYDAAGRWLDLSRSHGDGATLARELEIVLEKKLWIDTDRLSDQPTGEADDGQSARRDRLGEIPLDDSQVPILLERVNTDEGLRWKFAAITVARIPALYKAYGYGPLGEWLPSFFFETRVLDVELWQWAGLVVLVVASAIVSWALMSLAATLLGWAMRAVPSRARVLEVLTGPLRLAVAVALFSGAKYLLGLTLVVQAVLGALESMFFVVAIAWGALRVVDVFADLVDAQLRRAGQQAAVTLIPPGRKTVKVLVVGLAVIGGLDSLGFDTTAVLAGLGVGGIAVALAAQKTVENLFGGASLLADRPVRVGDFCRFGDKVGTVEEIGLRSTRVRTLDRTVISVPNSEFATLQLENFAQRDRIWYHPRIGLRYETTPDQIRCILVEIRRMLYAHPKVNPDPARIRFVNFGAYSLDLDIFAYVDVQDYGEYLEVAEDLNLRIMDIVQAAGSSFAFPSQTTYLERGEGLDDKRARAAEQEVERWRHERSLYLPRFPEEKIEELRGTLDYPEKGTPSGPDGGTRS